MKLKLALTATFLSLTLLLSGCFLAANREINLLVTRTDTGGSEVTVTYRMPPPPQGKVYVLWVVNPDVGRTVRVGVVEPSAQLRAIRTRVDFWATGAVVSIESSPDVDRMSGDSELVSGQVEPSNATSSATPSVRQGGAPAR